MEAHKIREPLTDDEKGRFESYATAIFSRLGMNLELPGTRDTLQRWLRALWDMKVYDGDAKLSTLFPVECPVCPDEEKTHVVEGPIRFTGLCEHHVLPIRGSAGSVIRPRKSSLEFRSSPASCACTLSALQARNVFATKLPTS